jgi:hypothetical protein
MKVLAEHKFKNNKAIRVMRTDKTYRKKHGIPEVDTLALCFAESEDYERTTAIRPDEAIILIGLLSEAVYKSVKSYEV